MPGLIENLLNLSVRQNGVLIPFRALDAALANYTQQLIIHHHDDNYPIGLIGSCLTIHYKGYYLLLCCRHQLRNALEGGLYEDVGLLDRDGGSHCTSAGIRYFAEGNENDLHDLAVFDFTAPCNERPHMKERFLNINEGQPDIWRNQVVALIASGFPLELQEYEMEKKHLGIAQRNIYCEPAPQSAQSKDTTLMLIKPIVPMDYNPDGLSGGGVHMIYQFNDEFHVGLGGIIARANANNIHVMKIDRIMQFINSWL